tara:strand:- start:2476 stop:2757 length:282 start_codon:yes stop_codon:yes gene_type:complete
MQDEIIPPIYDGQPGRNDFAKIKKGNMKDEDWADSISLSRSSQKINYRELDDESLNRMIKDVRNEYERRQRERFDMALKRRSDLELRKELQGE